MKSSLWMLLTVIFAGLGFMGCPAGSKTADAGVDGGSHGDSGTSSYACDVPTQDCTQAGEACMYVNGGTASACLFGLCDLVHQTGCSDTDKCTYVTDAGVTARACATNGTADAGETCSAEGAGCNRGLACVGNPGGGVEGTCRRYCNTDSDCALTEECGVEFLDFTEQGVVESPSFCTVALPACDLLAGGSCMDAGPEITCYAGTHRPTCLATGSATLDQACTRSNDCVPGLQCMGAPPDARCRALCRLPSGAPSCPSGRACTQVAIPGAPEAGVCL